jgi:hypothetical protein
MPFKSKAQARKCFALKARGKAKGWNCEEWASHTNFSKLPERKSSAYLAPLAKQGNAALWRPLSQLLKARFFNAARMTPFVAKYVGQKWAPLVTRYGSLAINPMLLSPVGGWIGSGVGSLFGSPEIGQMIGSMVPWFMRMPGSMDPKTFARRFYFRRAPGMAKLPDNLAWHNAMLSKLHAGLQGATGAYFLGHTASALMSPLTDHEMPGWAPWTLALGAGLLSARNPIQFAGSRMALQKGLWANLGPRLNRFSMSPAVILGGGVLAPVYGSLAGLRGQQQAMTMMDDYLKSQGIGGIEGAMNLLEQYGPMAQKLEQLNPQDRQKIMELANNVDPRFLKFMSQFV